jgi:hypothetical protein
MNAMTQSARGPVSPNRLQTAGLGLVVAAAASGLVAYAAYGDPTAPQHQKDAVPSIIVIAVVIAAAVFGALVPKALTALDGNGERRHLWALVPAIVALLTTVAFWSGVPLIIGVAAAMLGVAGRREAIARGAATRPYTATLVLAAVAAVGSVAVTLIGNLAH